MFPDTFQITLRILNQTLDSLLYQEFGAFEIFQAQTDIHNYLDSRTSETSTAMFAPEELNSMVQNLKEIKAIIVEDPSGKFNGSACILGK